MMWEVFNLVDGIPVFRTRWKLLAKLVAWWKGLDYEREGDGWL
jgi:hypothetical protein